MLLLDEIPVVFIFLYCIDSSHLSTDAPQQVVNDLKSGQMLPSGRTYCPES